MTIQPPERRLVTEASLADPESPAHATLLGTIAAEATGGDVAVVRHGGDPGAARPAANVVWWIGSAEPANALAHDAWDDSEVAP